MSEDSIAATTRPWRIVVIDHSRDERAEIRGMLLGGSGRQYKLSEAATGEAGVRAVLDPTEGLPACLILDDHLPDMDAVEVLASLADPHGRLACPVVVLSESEDDDRARALLRAGAQDYLGKGWMRLGSLARAVENAAERWELARDLHDREEALRASEERLRMALGAARAGSWAWDLSTGGITWSPENYALYGVDPDSGPPTYRTWEARIHPDDLDGANAILREALSGRTPEFRSEFRVIHPTKGLRWILGLAKAEFGPAGNPLRMGGINLDITDRKFLEQSLADQDRRKDEFLATLAHELRTPLAPIRVGLAVLKLAPPDDPLVSTTREMMERQVALMVRLVDDMLDVSRIGNGKVELRRGPVQLRAMLDHASEASRPLIDAAGHRLVIKVPDEPVWLNGDFTRLAQVLGNLLNNAAKYTPDGGCIEVSASIEGDGVIIRVRDDGAGISADMLPRIFGMFTQIEGTLGRSQGGLGIGLSLVKKLVELHGGTIGADSAGLGLGSTFTMCMPLGTPPASVPPSDATARPAPLAAGRPGLRVLVVDDNEDGAASLAMLLGMYGHSVQIAHDGQGALRIAPEFRPDLLLLDIGLPGIDGNEVCRRLRKEAALEGATFVALTGRGPVDNQAHARDAGFDLHLMKPVDLEHLEAVLARIIEGRARVSPAPIA